MGQSKDMFIEMQSTVANIHEAVDRGEVRITIPGGKNNGKSSALMLRDCRGRLLEARAKIEHLEKKLLRGYDDPEERERQRELLYTDFQ